MTTTIETAATELETAIAATEATPAPVRRPSLSNESLRSTASGAVLRVRTDADTPETDYFIYLEDKIRADNYDSRRITNITYYTLAKNGTLERYVYGPEAENFALDNVVSVESSDLYAWQRAIKWSPEAAPGQFFKVNTGYLPQPFRAELDAAGKTMPRYSTFAEVLEVKGTGNSAEVTARIFSNATDTPESMEFGNVTGTPNVSDFLSVDLISPEMFHKNYGLMAEAVDAEKLYYINAELHAVESIKGSTATFRPCDEMTGLPDTSQPEKSVTRGEMSSVTLAAESVAAYVATLPDESTRNALIQLSRNTITRALKHADSNDYCSETAVALTSAGHVMPEVHITGRIVIELDVKSKEYMLLRKLFGASNDDVSNLSEVLKKNWGRVADRIPGAPRNLPEGATVELSAEMAWKSPKLRPLS